MEHLISMPQAFTGHRKPAVFWLRNIRVLCECPAFLLALSVAAIACVGTPGGSQRASDVEVTIRVDGLDRTYLVHRPSGFNSSKALPMVMMLHGRGGSSHLAAHDFGWIEKSDQEGFLIVFPQALPIDPARPSGSTLPANFIRGWSTPTNDTLWWTHELATNYPYVANPDYSRVVHPPDAPFLAAVLHDVLHRFRGDSQHVYIAGFSSGGEMTSDFAQFASEEITAAAIVRSDSVDDRASLKMRGLVRERFCISGFRIFRRCMVCCWIRALEFVQAPHLVARMPDHKLWMAFLKDAEAIRLG
jgi:predicted peptidase